METPCPNLTDNRKRLRRKSALGYVLVFVVVLVAVVLTVRFILYPEGRHPVRCSDRVDWDAVSIADRPGGARALMHLARYCDHWHHGEENRIILTVCDHGLVTDQFGNSTDIYLDDWKLAYEMWFEGGARTIEFQTAPSDTFSSDPGWPYSDDLGHVSRFLYQISADDPDTMVLECMGPYKN